ncbi:MAG TPA: hypothetical protein VJT77_01125 [Burkholderiales bacterium]|nr:hypothetical protein [Burkholderiales bacterium]
MRVWIGEVVARCEQCGAEEFQALPAGTVPAHELVCFSCGAVVTRRALLTQIAQRTMKRAERFIEHSKRNRTQPRKR